MSSRINLADSVVTAGKFVATTDDTTLLTQKVRALSNQINLNTSSNRSTAISNMLSDNIITPAEKKTLQAELSHIEAAFTATTASVKQMELEDSIEYLQYKAAFDTLKSRLEPILENMNTTTTTTESLDRYVQAYSSAGDTLASYMIAFSNSSLASVQDYQLKVTANNVSPTPTDTITFTAHVYMKNDAGLYEEFTDEQYNTYRETDSDGNITYPKLFDWEIAGTTDDSYYKTLGAGRKTVKIPASAFDSDSITVKFYSPLLIS